MFQERFVCLFVFLFQLEKEPSVFVLQRRVKSLQDKVENQKSKIKELEGELQTRIAREQKLLAQGSRYKTRELLSGAPQGDAHAGDKATMTTTQPDIPSGGAAAAAAGDRMVIPGLFIFYHILIAST